MPDEKNTVHAYSNLRDLCVIRLYMDDRIRQREREGEWSCEAEISHHILSQITPFSHSIFHSFPNELNGLRAESHLFKTGEVGQKIDLPGELICAHAKLDRCCVRFFFPQLFYYLMIRNNCGVVTTVNIFCFTTDQ